MPDTLVIFEDGWERDCLHQVFRQAILQTRFLWFRSHITLVNAYASTRTQFYMPQLVSQSVYTAKTFLERTLGNYRHYCLPNLLQHGILARIFYRAFMLQRK